MQGWVAVSKIVSNLKTSQGSYRKKNRNIIFRWVVFTWLRKNAKPVFVKTDADEKVMHKRCQHDVETMEN